MLQLDRIVNYIFDSITWLFSVTESNRVWLVDCGDIAPIVEKIKGKTVEGVLLTHAHFDHIFGLNELLVHFPDCKVYTNVFGREALANAKLNMSFYQERPMTFNSPNIIVCEEGETITLFSGISAKVYETPGHHPSCLTYMVGDYLFTGDSYIPGVKVVTNLPKGDKIKAENSLSRIQLLAEGKRVFPGHQI